jgi:quinol monooxygenase YgiN
MLVKPGMEHQLTQVSDQWWRERAPNVRGAVSSTVFKTDANPNEFIFIAIFDNKANYVANSNDPETDAWFQQLRACLEADPQWTDGEVVFSRQP